jgi:diaminopimelate epimerase
MWRKFYKLHGAGNDFVFIDDREETFPLAEQSLIARLCHRRYGIGSDGLVVLRPSSLADCRMIYFNADGKEASFCGNALRCAALAMRACGYGQEDFFIETPKGVMRSSIRKEQIETSFPLPVVRHWPLILPIEEKNRPFYVVDAGVPHAVCLVDDLDSLHVNEVAPAIRFHPLLAPEGANVTFVDLSNGRSIAIRTYERGVEGETFSCGSGAVAAAYVISELHKAPKVAVKTRAGDWFEVDTIKWLLTGSACLVYEGSVCIKEDSPLSKNMIS